MNFLKKMKIKNLKLTLSVITTLIPFTLWLMATISYVYVNYLGSLIFNLSQTGQLILFILLPFTGLFTGILTYRVRKTKLKLFLIAVNSLLLGIVVLATLSRIS